MADFTRDEKRAAVQREVAQRRKVYPRLVSDGRITQAFADAQIAIMEAIAEDYREKDLFDG